jgi:hypothetical protein
MDDKNKIPQESAPAAQPIASVPATSQAPQSVVPQTTPVVTTGGKKKTPLFIAVIVAVLVVAGAVAYGVYAYMTNTPDYLLSKSVEQLGKETAIAARFKFTSGSDNNGVTFSGDIAARGDQGSKSGEAILGIGTGNSRVTVSSRVIDETVYLRFGSLNNLTNLVRSFSPAQASTYDSPEFKAALARVDNKWFSLTKDEIASVAQTSGSSAATGELKPDDLKKMLEIYNKHQFFKADKSHNDEVIDGVKSAHFTIKMDKANYKAFLNELKSANLSSIKVTNSDIDNADKDVDEFAREAAVDMWVARDTKKLKQVKVASLDTSSPGSLTLTLVTNLPAFDKLEKPSDAKPFSEFMTTLLGPSSLYDDSYYMAQ